MRERARDMAREILKNHHPVYIEEKDAREIDRIAAAAQKEIALIRRGRDL